MAKRESRLHEGPVVARATAWVTLAAVAVAVAGCGSGKPADGAASGAPDGSGPNATADAAASGAQAGAGPTTPAPAASAAERAEAIRSAAPGWRKVEGEDVRGDATTRYAAYFDGGQLRYLETNVSLGDYGTRDARYYFENGGLFYYTGEKPSGVQGTGGPGDLPPNVPVVAEFRGGEVLRAVSREHYGEKKLDPMLVDGIRNTAALLAGIAQDELSAQQR